MVVALQAALPNARVVYASATGASEPANLGYMSRLGNFGFHDQLELLRTVDSAGAFTHHSHAQPLPTLEPSAAFRMRSTPVTLCQQGSQLH